MEHHQHSEHRQDGMEHTMHEGHGLKVTTTPVTMPTWRRISGNGSGSHWS